MPTVLLKYMRPLVTTRYGIRNFLFENSSLRTLKFTLFWSIPGAIFQKQSPRDVLLKRFSANIQQVYRKTPMRKCNFKKVALKSNFSEKHLWGTASNVFSRNSSFSISSKILHLWIAQHNRNIVKDLFAQAEWRRRTS